MTVLRSIALAFACFSAIPMPQVAWNDRNMRYLMAAFPLVGVAVGAAVWGWVWAAGALGFGAVLCGAGITLVPLLVTGGIHLDGFADVVDAQSSHAPLERKRQIMKDPHVGAFAVMGIVSYLLAYFALSCELDARLMPVVACVPVVSRCLCGLATLLWPAAASCGMLATLREAALRPLVPTLLGGLLVLVCTAMLVADLRTGMAAAVGAVLSFAWARHFVRTQFDGMSGDLSGFVLQVVEIAMLAGIAAAGRLV